MEEVLPPATDGAETGNGNGGSGADTDGKTPAPLSSSDTGVPIACPGGWWASMRKRVHTARDSGGRIDKAAGVDTRLRPPMWYPRRSIEVTSADGACRHQVVDICRYHNYDQKRGCSKGRSSSCPFDHTHCHFCLEVGHVAFQCPAFLATLVHAPEEGGEARPKKAVADPIPENHWRNSENPPPPQSTWREQSKALHEGVRAARAGSPAVLEAE